MTATPDAPLSKGMMMITVYREARLRQRAVLQTSLQETHVTYKVGGSQGQTAGEPAQVVVKEAAPALGAGLVIASLVSLVDSDRRSEWTGTPMPAFAQDVPADVAAMRPSDDAAAAVSMEPVRHDPPLAEIGFGPGMLIRLSQLGLRTTGDLADADANDLRTALGDISRLVDVEAWIASARITASHWSSGYRGGS